MTSSVYHMTSSVFTTLLMGMNTTVESLTVSV